jgi:putative ABC transport system permease protein
VTTFYLTYLRRELSHRRRQALLMAAGLAVGAGLVVTVTAASAGVGDAETAVLHSLYGVGTDVSVTKPAPDSSPDLHHLSTSGSSSVAAFSPGKKPLPVDRLTAAPGLDWLDAASVARAARLPGVAAAAGGLTLTDSQFVVPSLAQVAHGQQPPANALPSPFTVDGVDLTHPGLGPYADVTLVAGHGFSPAQEEADVAVVDAGYARTHRLRVGSTVTIGFHQFAVIGLVSQPPASTADVFIPLARAQALAAPTPTHPRADMVTNVYIAAASAAGIPAVRAELARLLPSATVSSSAGLASQVSGSLSGAATLTADLGRWLTGGALVAAFAVACLLALAAISRRYTEIGTLKALGWPGRRIIGQIMGESLVIGVVGAVAGVIAGIGGAAIVRAVAPKLSAIVAQSPGSQPPQDVTLNSTGMHTGYPSDSFHTITVHMGAPVSLTAVALAIGLAVAGALLAGALGSWRASRLEPAAALASPG